VPKRTVRCAFLFVCREFCSAAAKCWAIDRSTNILSSVTHREQNELVCTSASASKKATDEENESLPTQSSFSRCPERPSERPIERKEKTTTKKRGPLITAHMNREHVGCINATAGGQEGSNEQTYGNMNTFTRIYTLCWVVLGAHIPLSAETICSPRDSFGIVHESDRRKFGWV